jgi:TIR domain
MYNVVLVNLSSDARANGLIAGISSEASRLNIQINFLNWDEISSDFKSPTVVVYLGSKAAKNDDLCKSQIQRALDLKFPIIPVVESDNTRTQELPHQLQYIKSITWLADDIMPLELQAATLEILGIIEKERRAFISYRRHDAMNVAIQLYHALTERRFRVFLDQFQTNPSENIQDQIAESLEDMAFVLLLQSPDMYNSKWVDVEITHALKAHLPIVVLRWSNVTIDLPKISEANLPTIMFDPTTDMVGNTIQQFKVDEILQSVEHHYSEGLLRRRRESIIAARLFAESKGWQVIEDPPWKLILTQNPRGGPPVLLGVTPRLARAEDLYELDDKEPSLKLPVMVQWRKLLLQAATDLPARRRKLWNGSTKGRILKYVLAQRT